MVNEKLESEIAKIKECVLSKAKEILSQMLLSNSKLVDECTYALSDLGKCLDEVGITNESRIDKNAIMKKIFNIFTWTLTYIRKNSFCSVKKDIKDTLDKQVTIILNSQIH